MEASQEHREISKEVIESTATDCSQNSDDDDVQIIDETIPDKAIGSNNLKHVSDGKQNAKSMFKNLGLNTLGMTLITQDQLNSLSSKAQGSKNNTSQGKVFYLVSNKGPTSTTPSSTSSSKDKIFYALNIPKADASVTGTRPVVIKKLNPQIATNYIKIAPKGDLVAQKEKVFRDEMFQSKTLNSPKPQSTPASSTKIDKSILDSKPLIKPKPPPTSSSSTKIDGDITFRNKLIITPKPPTTLSNSTQMDRSIFDSKPLLRPKPPATSTESPKEPCNETVILQLPINSVSNKAKLSKKPKRKAKKKNRTGAKALKCKKYGSRKIKKRKICEKSELTTGAANFSNVKMSDEKTEVLVDTNAPIESLEGKEISTAEKLSTLIVDADAMSDDINIKTSIISPKTLNNKYEDERTQENKNAKKDRVLLKVNDQLASIVTPTDKIAIDSLKLNELSFLNKPDIKYPKTSHVKMVQVPSSMVMKTNAKIVPITSSISKLSKTASENTNECKIQQVAMIPLAMSHSKQSKILPTASSGISMLNKDTIITATSFLQSICSKATPVILSKNTHVTSHQSTNNTPISTTKTQVINKGPDSSSSCATKSEQKDSADISNEANSSNLTANSPMLATIKTPSSKVTQIILSNSLTSGFKLMSVVPSCTNNSCSKPLPVQFAKGCSSVDAKGPKKVKLLTTSEETDFIDLSGETSETENCDVQPKPMALSNTQKNKAIVLLDEKEVSAKPQVVYAYPRPVASSVTSPSLTSSAVNRNIKLNAKPQQLFKNLHSVEIKTPAPDKTVTFKIGSKQFEVKLPINDVNAKVLLKALTSSTKTAQEHSSKGLKTDQDLAKTGKDTSAVPTYVLMEKEIKTAGKYPQPPKLSTEDHSRVVNTTSKSIKILPLNSSSKTYSANILGSVLNEGVACTVGQFMPKQFTSVSKYNRYDSFKSVDRSLSQDSSADRSRNLLETTRKQFEETLHKNTETGGIFHEPSKSKTNQFPSAAASALARVARFASKQKSTTTAVSKTSPGIFKTANISNIYYQEMKDNTVIVYPKEKCLDNNVNASTTINTKADHFTKEEEKIPKEYGSVYSTTLQTSHGSVPIMMVAPSIDSDTDSSRSSDASLEKPQQQATFSDAPLEKRQQATFSDALLEKPQKDSFSDAFTPINVEPDLEECINRIKEGLKQEPEDIEEHSIEESNAVKSNSDLSNANGKINNIDNESNMNIVIESVYSLSENSAFCKPMEMTSNNTDQSPKKMLDDDDIQTEDSLMQGYEIIGECEVPFQNETFIGESVQDNSNELDVNDCTDLEFDAYDSSDTESADSNSFDEMEIENLSYNLLDMEKWRKKCLPCYVALDMLSRADIASGGRMSKRKKCSKFCRERSLNLACKCGSLKCPNHLSASQIFMPQTEIQEQKLPGVFHEKRYYARKSTTPRKRKIEEQNETLSNVENSSFEDSILDDKTDQNILATFIDEYRLTKKYRKVARFLSSNFKPSLENVITAQRFLYRMSKSKESKSDYSSFPTERYAIEISSSVNQIGQLLGVPLSTQMQATSLASYQKPIPESCLQPKPTKLPPVHKSSSENEKQKKVVVAKSKPSVEVKTSEIVKVDLVKIKKALSSLADYVNSSGQSKLINSGNIGYFLLNVENELVLVKSPKLKPGERLQEHMLKIVPTSQPLKLQSFFQQSINSNVVLGKKCTATSSGVGSATSPVIQQTNPPDLDRNISTFDKKAENNVHRSLSETIICQNKEPDSSVINEKRVKRRKLEQKYPLPPGIKIKTEPVEFTNEKVNLTSGATRHDAGVMNLNCRGLQNRQSTSLQQNVTNSFNTNKSLLFQMSRNSLVDSETPAKLLFNQQDIRSTPCIPVSSAENTNKNDNSGNKTSAGSTHLNSPFVLENDKHCVSYSPQKINSFVNPETSRTTAINLNPGEETLDMKSKNVSPSSNYKSTSNISTDSTNNNLFETTKESENKSIIKPISSTCSLDNDKNTPKPTSRIAVVEPVLTRSKRKFEETISTSINNDETTKISKSDKRPQKFRRSKYKKNNSFSNINREPPELDIVPQNDKKSKECNLSSKSDNLADTDVQPPVLEPVFDSPVPSSTDEESTEAYLSTDSGVSSVPSSASASKSSLIFKPPTKISPSPMSSMLSATSTRIQRLKEQLKEKEQQVERMKKMSGLSS